MHWIYEGAMYCLINIYLLFFFCERLLDTVEDPALRRVTDKFWDWKIREFPEDATAEGFHAHEDKMESFTFDTMDFRKVSVLFVFT